MDKKTIILIVLGVVALFVVVYQFRGMFSSGKPTPSPIATKRATSSAPKLGLGAAVLAKKINSLPAGAYEAHIATVKESDIAFQKSGFKNPMTPAEGESEKPQSWVPTPVGRTPVVVDPEVEILAKDDSIEGIVWNEKDPLALINNQVVGIGEELEDGAVVTEITRDMVRFSRNGKRYYLVLREE
jgi:type II secretory pathway component PulC